MINYKLFSFKITFNNQKYLIKTPKPLSLDQIIKFFDYKQNLIVLECNKKILSQTSNTKKILKNKDEIETITIVGGG